MPEFLIEVPYDGRARNTKPEGETMIAVSMSKLRSAVMPLLHATGAVAVLMLASCAGGSPGAGKNADTVAEAKALAKLDDDWSAAAATRDAGRVAAFYAEDAIAYPPNEPVAVGRAAAEKVWAAYFADSTYTISWKTDHADVVGDLGYTAGAYQDSFGKGKYLCVWKRQGDGSWKAIHDMWNTDSK